MQDLAICIYTGHYHLKWTVHLSEGLRLKFLHLTSVLQIML